MPRSLDAALLAAMNSGSFTPWFQLQLMDLDHTSVMYSTTDVLGFELDGLTCKVTFHDPEYWDDWYTYRLLRGIIVGGVPNYVISSNYWPTSDRHDKRRRTLEGHVFPNIYFTTPGDVTYHQLIDTVCAEFDLGVVFANPAAAWLDYQFYPDGRTLVLGDAKQFFTILRQKYLVFATDYDEDVLFFYQAHNTSPAYPAGYTVVSAGKLVFPGHGSTKSKSFLSRDENSTTHTSGDADHSLHNLGFLPSTASHPARTTFKDTNDWIMQDIPPNLKYLDFDSIMDNFDVATILLWPAKFKEVFNKKLSPSWQWQARYLDIFGNTEGGAIPSTLEAAAPYTPLNTSTFNKNLNTSHNNLQALAEAVDELTTGPAINAATAKDPLVDADIFPVMDSETATHVVKKFSWLNMKARIFAAFGLSLDAGTAITAPDDLDLLPLIDHSLASKETKAFPWASLLSRVYEAFGLSLNSAATKDPPVDADLFPLMDSELAGKGIKGFSWANLKSRLYIAFGPAVDGATAITTLEDVDLLPVVDHSLGSKGTKGFSWLDLKNGVLDKFGYFLEWSDPIITPADDDLIPVEDHSDGSNPILGFTWANLKARLKTYFDTLYAVVANGVTNGNTHDHVGGDGANLNILYTATSNPYGGKKIFNCYTSGAAHTDNIITLDMSTASSQIAVHVRVIQTYGATDAAVYDGYAFGKNIAGTKSYVIVGFDLFKTIVAGCTAPTLSWSAGTGDVTPNTLQITVNNLYSNAFVEVSYITRNFYASF
jgi:hypothetical protein